MQIRCYYQKEFDSLAYCIHNRCFWDDWKFVFSEGRRLYGWKYEKRSASFFRNESNHARSWNCASLRGGQKEVKFFQFRRELPRDAWWYVTIPAPLSLDHDRRTIWKAIIMIGMVMTKGLICGRKVRPFTSCATGGEAQLLLMPSLISCKWGLIAACGLSGFGYYCIIAMTQFIKYSSIFIAWKIYSYR